VNRGSNSNANAVREFCITGGVKKWVQKCHRDHLTPKMSDPSPPGDPDHSASFYAALSELILPHPFHRATASLAHAYFVNNEQITPTAETCSDLFYIAFDTTLSYLRSGLVEVLDAAVLANPAELLAPAIQWAIHNNPPTDALEAVLRSNFLD
jgi:hypothetical protein